ncbi:MAG: LysM peptidoglycan-binding domain-containing protein [Planctomycetota bacterium]|jgi:Tfp pilus assembly protein FimV
MTSDAKVGVLLGLVFIFIVAFLINGLGDLRSDQDNNELTEKMVRSYSRSPGLGGSERKVSQKVIEEIEPILPDLEKIWEGARAGDGEVRFSAPLPEIFKKEESIESKPESKLENLSRGELMKAEAPAKVVKSEPEKEDTLKVTRITPPKARIYVVKSGENLATIAKEVYGEEEGNRMVNVNGIYEANRERMKSRDEVFEGQKLLIPPLAGAAVTEEKPSEALQEARVEVVESIGRRHEGAEQTKEAVKPSKEGRWYEVKEDDNLWKIATSELGDGNRYTEIAKLNSGQLRNEDSLNVGMRLMLPVR